MKYVLNNDLNPKYAHVNADGYLYLDNCVVECDYNGEVVKITTPEDRGNEMGIDKEKHKKNLLSCLEEALKIHDDLLELLESMQKLAYSGAPEETINSCMQLIDETQREVEKINGIIANIRAIGAMLE